MFPFGKNMKFSFIGKTGCERVLVACKVCVKRRIIKGIPASLGLQDVCEDWRIVNNSTRSSLPRSSVSPREIM